MKLFLVFLRLSGILWGIGPLLGALDIESLVVRAVVALFVAFYFPYLIMLGLGWAVALYKARRENSIEPMATPGSPSNEFVGLDET